MGWDVGEAAVHMYVGTEPSHIRIHKSARVLQWSCDESLTSFQEDVEGSTEAHPR